ncbi:MAG TPA: SUMF1/EgtB/PvdO family nonheme iron enzyme [Nitrospiria bacterium]|nr:SUMF1/EgtB/PvdO family nonheme iron enzyme [Nitrospiria bacterium]
MGPLAVSVALAFTAATAAAAQLPSSAEPLLINQIAVAPSNPDVLYAAGRPAGVLKSTDRGRTWRPARDGILNTSAYHVVVHPTNADTVYVGTYGGGVYRTRDGGRSWDAASAGLGNANIHALYLDPSRPERLIVSTSTGDVFQTLDEGARWTAYGQGLPAMEGEVLAVFLSRPNDAWLGQGTLYSRGARDPAWRAVGQDLGAAAITVLAADADGRLYAGTRRQGLLRSIDNGATWSDVAPEFDRRWIRLVLPGPNGRVWVSALRRGLYRSDDRGATWIKVGAGLPENDDVETLAMDPADPNRLYAGTHDHGLWLSSDGGRGFAPPDHVMQERVADIIASLIDRPVKPGASQAPAVPSVFQKCSGCHGWTDPALSRKPTYWRVAANQRDWAPTVARMAPGAGLNAAEMWEIVAFLTRYTEQKGDRLLFREKVACPLCLVEIPAGWFLMGSEPRDPTAGLWLPYDNTESPQRRIWLDPYAIDREEVRVADYMRWRRAQPDAAGTESSPIDAEVGARPMVGVTWSEADRYCRAMGRRLPTEAEWEKAARGAAGRLFPWGDDPPDARRAVFGRPASDLGEIAAVDALLDGRSPYGVLNMAGNAAEWVADWSGIDWYAVMPERNPKGPTSGRYKVVRGGSWRSDPVMLRAATRSAAEPETRRDTVGFRCAGDPPGVPP